MNRHRQRSSLFAALCVHFAWIHVGFLDQTYALNESHVAGTNSSGAELVLNCNAGQSAAGYGLAWLSLLDDLPPRSTVKYAGVGVDQEDGGIPHCSLSTPHLCGWALNGTSDEWTVTSSLDHYLGPILDYRWEGFTDIRTDGSYELQKPIYVGAGIVAISVKAPRDAHIKLSFGEDPTSSPTYYVILGGWWNTLSVIRRCPRGIPAGKDEPPVEQCFHRREETKEANVLSPWQWKHFILSLSSDGEVSVNRTDGTQLLAWKDPNSFVKRKGVKKAFYLNFRTHGVVGHWKVHDASHMLIKASTSKREPIRLFSSNFKINQSTLCVTLLHFLSTWKNTPAMGLVIEKKDYVNMIYQQIGSCLGQELQFTMNDLLIETSATTEFPTHARAQIDSIQLLCQESIRSFTYILKLYIYDSHQNQEKGWTLIKYMGKVPKKHFGKNANIVISVNINLISSIAIQDFRPCPKIGLRRIAQLRIQRSEMRPNESFVCLPLPNPKRMFLQCPPVEMDRIDGVCVSAAKESDSSCHCKSYADFCSPPCNASNGYNLSQHSCQPDPETCSFSPNKTADHQKDGAETTTSAQDWPDTEDNSTWSSTETTSIWTTSTEPEVTTLQSEREESVRPKAIKDLNVTSRSYSWLKIRWLGPEIQKLKNCSAFHISWWKTKLDKMSEITEEEKWEQTLEIGPQTMCPEEEGDYFCGTLWSLESSQNYTISVKPQCSDNQMLDDTAAIVTSETRQVPWGPSHVYVANRTESTIKLIWKARLPPPANMLHTFSVFYRESLLLSSNHTWNVVKISSNAGSDNFTCQIGNLSPGVLYEFCIHVDKVGDNLTNENGDSSGANHHPVEFTFRENLTSVCTYTRTLLEKPYIPNGTILFRTCSWSKKFLNVPIALNFNHSESQDRLKIRAYLLCLTNIRSQSRTFDQHIHDELQKELGVKELHIAAELKKDLHKEFDFHFGDGAVTGGIYGNFANVPLNSSHIAKGETKFEVILVAVNEKNGGRRYSWQKASYPSECSRKNITLLLTSIGGVILFLLLVAAGVFLWKYRKNQKVMSNCLSKIRTFCCKRDDINREWKGLTKKERNAMHLEPIEPDDQIDYSSDSGHGSSLAQATIFS